MHGRRLALVALTMITAACAARPTLPPTPTTLQYPEFMYPVVPRELAAAGQATRIDVGWRYLQSGDLASAEREFAAALKPTPNFYPGRAASGYVAIARKDYEQALAAFDAAVKIAPAYVPGLVGRGQVLLALDRDDAALEAFEAALAIDGSLAELRQRVNVLRFRRLEAILDIARTAAGTGRLEEAEQAYARALAASPESAFLHRERAQVARRRGTVAAALDYFRRAVELDPTDVTSLVQIAELLEGQGNLADAEAAYRRAAAVEPSREIEARLAALATRAREAALPAEFRAIDGAKQITRGDLAALIGVRLEDALRDVPVQEVVMTDITGHWATPWITQVARAGVIEPFANHTFQPRAAVTRADLARAVSRLVALLAARHPELQPHLAARPGIADMPPAHLSYPAAAVAVASGAMRLADGARFDPARPASGGEAAEAVGRVRVLAGAR
jgi:tetratricopeptide (TPR) repeat protein